MAGLRRHHRPVHADRRGAGSGAGPARDARAPPLAASARDRHRPPRSTSTAGASCSSPPTTTSASPTTRPCAPRPARRPRRWGCGTGASRLIAGHLDLHAEVERQLAAFKGTEAALLFPSGYQANVGAITALVGRGDHVFSDALNHASIIDGCRLSRATVHVYPHRDVRTLRCAARVRSGRGAAAHRDRFGLLHGRRPGPAA